MELIGEYFTHHAYYWSDVFQTVLNQGKRTISNHVLYVIVEPVCTYGMDMDMDDIQSMQCD